MSCGHTHSSPSSSKIQFPLSQLQHVRRTRALTFRLWGGVSRLTSLILHQRRKWEAPQTPLRSWLPLWRGYGQQILFVCFPVTAIAAVLSRSPMTVKRSLNELENAGLIMRVRQGVGEPNRIYVLIPGKEDAALA